MLTKFIKYLKELYSTYHQTNSHVFWGREKRTGRIIGICKSIAQSSRNRSLTLRYILNMKIFLMIKGRRMVYSKGYTFLPYHWSDGAGGH